MAPPRSKPQHDDSRSEASSTKEKAGPSSSNAPNGKGRRAGGTAAGGSSLRDVVSVGHNNTAAGNTEATPSTTIDWTSFDSSTLNNYRYGYRLNTPSAFNKPYNRLILSQSAIGRMSPTMARKKEQRRQTHEQLANTARKHFNNMGIVENEIVVDFLYKVRFQGELVLPGRELNRFGIKTDSSADKNFRMRFDPHRPRQ
ncbi:hypothetical protein LARI1_G004450 [Lachnellula arida]|uniref:Histone deacetylase complex subunit SAP30 Sin3 binding domain-containing protein n=1 Tax=Lachnellula arida TaxID=1316785 RepID=A0A8T9BDB3_9HELO|nr:hypothetical protein LARI1_G004450 [Lachnellula arida]